MFKLTVYPGVRISGFSSFEWHEGMDAFINLIFEHFPENRICRRCSGCLQNCVTEMRGKFLNPIEAVPDIFGIQICTTPPFPKLSGPLLFANSRSRKYWDAVIFTYLIFSWFIYNLGVAGRVFCKHICISMKVKDW